MPAALLPLLASLLVSAPAWAGDPCPIGLQLAELTPAWRDRSADLAALQTQRQWLGLSYRGRGGRVVVTARSPGSPAAALLEDGDVVVEANGVAIADAAGLNAAIDAVPGTGEIALVIRRKGQRQELVLRRGPADPVVLAMLGGAARTDCREAALVSLSPAQQAAVAAAVFDENRGFRCDRAHTALAPHLESGTVVVVRGGRRVLVTAPGHATRCVAVGALDGPGGDAAAAALLETVVAGHVKDRHDNP